MSVAAKKMPYGKCYRPYLCYVFVAEWKCYPVRLGNSGLKVSRIILGTMQYGDKGWQQWSLGEEEAVEPIKYA